MFKRKTNKYTDGYSEKAFLLNEEKEKKFNEPKSKDTEKKPIKYGNVKYEKLKQQ